jgi:hypothetical protein
VAGSEGGVPDLSKVDASYAQGILYVVPQHHAYNVEELVATRLTTRLASIYKKGKAKVITSAAS